MRDWGANVFSFLPPQREATGSLFYPDTLWGGLGMLGIPPGLNLEGLPSILPGKGERADSFFPWPLGLPSVTGSHRV